MKTTTVEEFDGEGKLVKRTVTTKDDGQSMPIYPVYPLLYPTLPLPWQPGPTITWGGHDDLTGGMVVQ